MSLGGKGLGLVILQSHAECGTEKHMQPGRFSESCSCGGGVILHTRNVNLTNASVENQMFQALTP